MYRQVHDPCQKLTEAELLKIIWRDCDSETKNKFYQKMAIEKQLHEVVGNKRLLSLTELGSMFKKIQTKSDFINFIQTGFKNKSLKLTLSENCKTDQISEVVQKLFISWLISLNL